MNQTEVVAINGITSYDAKFAINMNYNSRAKAHWLGLSAGMMQDAAHGSLDKAFKFGIFSEGIGPLNYGFDFIRNNDGKYISSVKLVLPF
jgi:hypothetical protein